MHCHVFLEFSDKANRIKTFHSLLYIDTITRGMFLSMKLWWEPMVSSERPESTAPPTYIGSECALYCVSVHQREPLAGIKLQMRSLTLTSEPLTERANYSNYCQGRCKSLLYRVFFLTGTPPKSSKYKKINLGPVLT